MRELSMHIMDIAENGLSAGATLISIDIVEDRARDWLEIGVSDNGSGMRRDALAKATDPFYTTRTTRRVGLGLSLLREAARRCEGDFRLDSEEGKGTQVHATFRLSHIDRAPWGDMAGALTSLIAGNPEADFVYTHKVDAEEFVLDTRDLRRELEGVPLNSPSVIADLPCAIRESLAELQTGASANPSRDPVADAT